MGTTAGTPHDPPVYSWADGWSPGTKGDDPIIDAAGVPIVFPTYDEAVAWHRAPVDAPPISGYPRPGRRDDCAICGEQLDGECGEMYHPDHDEFGGIVHAQCGIAAGWEVA